MRIGATFSAALLLGLMSMACAANPAAAAGAPDELAGQWGTVFTSKKLVRVLVLRDRPTVSLAGPGAVLGQGPYFSTIMRDEEVPMDVEHAVSLEIQADGRFQLVTHDERAASPTNGCLVRSGAKREGLLVRVGGNVLLKSSGGFSRTVKCNGAPEDSRVGASVYGIRREGAVLVVTANDGTVWRLQK